MHTHFLLRALGQSAGVIRADEATQSYVIDSLTALSARYDLAFTDDDTSEVELRDYLAFARDVGLATQGADLKALLPLLPRAANGGFGKVQAAYQVRFGPEALAALLKVKALSEDAEARIRTTMRRMVLSNYLKNDAQLDVAFAYATPGVHAFFAEAAATFTNVSARVFNVAPVLAVHAPARVELGRDELLRPDDPDQHRAVDGRRRAGSRRGAGGRQGAQARGLREEAREVRQGAAGLRRVRPGVQARTASAPPPSSP